MKPDWLPDWKDPTAYPNPKDTTTEQWAWEFLRRNPEYQSDYVLWKEAHEGSYQPEGEATHQMFEELNRRIGLHKKYGLYAAMTDPARSELDGVAHLSAKYTNSLFYMPPVNGVNPLEHITMVPTSHKDFTIKFDLERPIKPQIERAQTLLEKWQKTFKEQGKINVNNQRNSVEMYPSFLRVLDAEASEIGIPEMASIIYPEEDNSKTAYAVSKKIRNNLKAAKKLRDSDYLFIPS